jgi:anti-sigma28 factor (negative regulator of flagellin synthesis)
MENSAKEEYVASIKKKIESGYYYSESILAKIVDELALVISEIAPNE